MSEREATTSISGGVAASWWWTAASTAQLAAGIYSYRRGTAGSCSLMPLRAFFVSSLILGSAASAAIASLRANGIHSVEDMKVVGENIRTAIGAPPPTVRKDVG